MRILVVTEKCGPDEALRDGGSRLVTTLRSAFGGAVSVAQFGDGADPDATWHFRYPPVAGDRFAQRLARGSFVADRVSAVAGGCTDVIYVHASMQFHATRLDARAWTFPMFLTPSYVASGERVPEDYTAAERRVLASTDRVITPSHLERRQLASTYGVDERKIRVVPRGVARNFFVPRVRSLDGPPSLCSVGSIKRQKNTVGLVRLFARLRARHAKARLKLIGPIQDQAYASELVDEIGRLGIGKAIDLVGHVPPEHLSGALADSHLHVSTATCETFGRAIFETLALGLPNVARRNNNAAAEYLADVPYARFVDDDAAALDAVDALLADLPRLSAFATEVGEIFDDRLLAGLLAAEIEEGDILGVADWDGTLFHKGDPARTSRSIEAFRQHPRRVICTARPVPDVLEALDAHRLPVDWIVGCSGAVVADGRGCTQWLVPMTDEVPSERRVVVDGEIVQLAGVAGMRHGLRIETYQDVSFATRWEASKLRSVVRLLRHLNWRGRVRAFGDGRYDDEMLAYFDGVRIGPTAASGVPRQALELGHV